MNTHIRHTTRNGQSRNMQKIHVVMKGKVFCTNLSPSAWKNATPVSNDQSPQQIGLADSHYGKERPSRNAKTRQGSARRCIKNRDVLQISAVNWHLEACQLWVRKYLGRESSGEERGLSRTAWHKVQSDGPFGPASEQPPATWARQSQTTTNKERSRLKK